MTRIKILEDSVRARYAAKNPARTPWADWLGDHHVFVVAENASRLAARKGANAELARAAALLHDIADTEMSRFDEAHEEASLKIARELLEEAGFEKTEISIVVDDAVRYHSCHDGRVPDSLEGRVLAAADSMAHLQTDFYIFAVWALGKEAMGLPEVKRWALKKIGRDFNDKILFDDVKDVCRQDYERLKELLGR